MRRRLPLALCLAALTACTPTPNDDSDPADGDVPVDVGPETDADTPDQAPPDMAPPDMAPPDIDRGPADPDMAPIDPDMAPIDPDMAPIDPDAGPVDPDMAPVDPDASPLDPDMAPVDPDASPLDPDAGPPDPDMAAPDPDMGPVDCVAGDRRALPCGRNGRGGQAQICVDDAWIDDGPCDDPDACVDGAEESGPCGPDDVGLSTRTCIAGQWGEVGECVLPGVCEPGEQDEIGCGLNGRGVAIRECVGGMWGPPGACDDPDVCRDGSDEPRACGINGRGEQLRDCVDGQWGPFAPCGDPDVCEDDAVEARACGLNDRGAQERVCAAGQWGDFARCDDPDRCVDGAVETEPCGLNGRGERSRECFQGDFRQPSDCADPDECVDGAREERACGERGDGVEFRLCDAGEWLDWSVCGGACADECPAGGRRCGGGGVELCGDSDDDPCLEWGPAEPCAAGSACVDGACRAPEAPIVINEVLYDQAGADGTETFIELWGPPGAALDGLSLVAVNGNDGRDYAVMPLDGVIGADGYYVVAEPGASAALAAVADLLIDGADLQNGPDSLQIRRGADVLDALGYGDAGVDFAGEGRPAADPADGSALTRGDHVDTDDNAADFVVAAATPRGEPGGEPPGECVDGETEARACGLNGRGEDIRDCVGGAWGPWSGCADRDACVDGVAEDRPCPGGRQQASVCEGGQWVAEGLCIGEREDISGGGDFAGVALPARGVDDYPLTMLADGRVMLEVDDGAGGCPGDTYLEVFVAGPDGPLDRLGGNDDSGPGVCSALDIALPAGEYIVRVRGFQLGAVPGDYVLHVAFEGGMIPVDGGGDFEGAAIPAGESSDYRFTLARRMRMVAFTSDGAGGCPGDTTMTLFGPVDGGVGQVAYNDDDDDVLCSRLELVLEPGAYTVRIAGFDGGAVPAYVLTVLFACVEGDRVVEACPGGVQALRCVDGEFAPEGPCGDPQCAEGEVEQAVCGLNGRGAWSRGCVGGLWGDFGPCDDPDVCVDGTDDPAACGLNGRGAAPARCVAGQNELLGPCVDPDTCVDDTIASARLCSLDEAAAACLGVHRPSPACGVNGWSMVSSFCFQGQPVEGDCVDPSICADGAIDTAPCGRNDRGVRSRVCVDGVWDRFGSCVDPDVCVDGDTLEYGCGPLSPPRRVERCVEGQWDARLDCAPIPPAEVLGYVEGSYEGYAIVRVASVLQDQQLQDAGLDRRVSGFIVGGSRPYADLAAVAARPDVVAGTFDLLWAEAQARGWVPFCGDGVVMEVEEQCDDGNDVAGDGCDPGCALETECGNGLVEGVEQCDDGDFGVFDGCSPSCRLETHPTLGPAEDGINVPILPYTQAEFTRFFDPYLFNLDLRQTSRVRFDVGYRTPHAFWYGGEFCPQAGTYNARLQARIGNTIFAGGGLCSQHGDGVYEFDSVMPPGRWTMSFDVDNGFDYVSMISGIIEPVDDAVCGDGVREGDEQCDDGNTLDRDGCSSGCLRQNITEANDNIDRDATASWSSSGTILRASGNLAEGGPFTDRDHFIFESTGGRTILQVSDAAGDGCDVDAQLLLYRGVNDDFDGIRLASAIDGGIDFCPRIETALAAGTYSAVVTLAPPGRGGPYRLEIRTSPGTWDDDTPAACQAWCLATTDCTPLSNDELAQCTRRCTDGTLPADEMLRVRDAEACLTDAGASCAALRACAADAAPVVDCDGLCDDLSACGVGDCAARCDAEAIVCADVARRLGGGCAEATPCVAAGAEPVESAACAAYCDARIACDPTIDRFECEQGCIAGPAPAAQRACAERATCDQMARCVDLDPAVPAECVAGCDAVDGCGLFADRAACEAYCAGHATQQDGASLAGLAACIEGVAACGFDLVHCFSPPICEGESAEVQVIDLVPGRFPLELTVTRAGIEDDFPAFCGFGGTIEHIAALRLDFPAEVSVVNTAARDPARFFLADRCDPEGRVACGFDGEDVVSRVLAPGVYYVGTEQNANRSAFVGELEIEVRPLDVGAVVIP